jgi:hypothetical protein
MNYYNDDPDIQQAMIEHRVRRGLWMSALFWMPLFLISAGCLVYFGIDVFFDLDRGGTVFLLVVLTVLSILFGFQGFQAVLDLFGKPSVIEGFVTRRWSKSDSFVMRTHYIRLGKRNIFRIDKLLHGDMQEGDYVRIRHYRHSAVVLSVAKIEAPEGAEVTEVIERREEDREAVFPSRK